MTKKQKFTKELLNTPPEYLINFKQELSKLEKNTLSKLSLLIKKGKTTSS